MRLTPSAGTVAVSNVTGSTLATDLGIASAAVAQVNGGDLDPGITLQTTLASLNGGTGIGPTAGTGLVINNGGQTHTVDLSTATTIEDVFNLIRTADSNLNLGINDARNGLAISSRISGADFSIGENNGGTNAAGLGIATFSASTPLSELNYGRGVDVDSGQIYDLPAHLLSTPDLKGSGLEGAEIMETSIIVRGKMNCEAGAGLDKQGCCRSSQRSSLKSRKPSPGES